MTARNILITSLDSMENRTEHRFFYIKDGRKTRDAEQRCHQVHKCIRGSARGKGAG